MKIGIAALMGETLTAIKGLKAGSSRAQFSTVSGRCFVMSHDQDCSETVQLEDVAGEVVALLHTPITLARADSSQDNPPPHADSFTWTFYTIGTVKGTVVLRWLGESNGYYSEDVSFEEVTASAPTR